MFPPIGIVIFVSTIHLSVHIRSSTENLILINATWLYSPKYISKQKTFWTKGKFRSVAAIFGDLYIVHFCSPLWGSLEQTIIPISVLFVG